MGLSAELVRKVGKGRDPGDIHSRVASVYKDWVIVKRRSGTRA